jgi:hypothetical protein
MLDANHTMCSETLRESSQEFSRASSKCNWTMVDKFATFSIRCCFIEECYVHMRHDLHYGIYFILICVIGSVSLKRRACRIAQEQRLIRRIKRDFLVTIKGILWHVRFIRQTNDECGINWTVNDEIKVHSPWILLKHVGHATECLA